MVYLSHSLWQLVYAMHFSQQFYWAWWWACIVSLVSFGLFFLVLQKHLKWWLNSWSPNNYIQILQTNIHTFRQRITWKNLIKDQCIFPLVIIIVTCFFQLHWYFKWRCDCRSGNCNLSNCKWTLKRIGSSNLQPWVWILLKSRNFFQVYLQLLQFFI